MQKEVYLFDLKNLTFELFGYLQGNSLTSTGIKLGEKKYSYTEMMEKLEQEKKELYEISVGSLNFKMSCLFFKEE